MGGLGSHISQRDREYFEEHGEWYPGQKAENRRLEGKDAKIKCPWCGRRVKLKNGRILPHIQSPKVQCVGNGQPYKKEN